jgi:serine/threonine protein kinase
MLEQQQRVADLFAAALDLEDGEQADFLARECGGQPALLAQVKSLLKADAQGAAVGFLSDPALNVEAQQYADELEAETRVGQLCGHYRILSLIGEGGMGEVYLAEDTVLSRKVALKLIKGGLKTKEVLRRFHNERQILANLEHPNIARLLDGGMTADGLPFFVMEYVEGPPIDVYADTQQLDITERLKLFRTVCSAISYAHQRLVIHRDIKPSNILVTADGMPKLLDFGIAKLFDPTQTRESREATATLMRALTPEYASPEQITGERVTTATDIYSLSVLLYELLTGQRPYRFKSRKPDDVANAICHDEAERPSQAIAECGMRNADLRERRPSSNPQSVIRNPKLLRGDLDNIILTALRKEPERRYASVSDFSEDIRRHLVGLPVKARKDTFAYRASKFVRRNKIAVAAAALILLTLIGGIIATAWEAHVARAERTRAERRFNDVRRMANSFMFELNDEIEKGPTKAREMVVKKALEYLDNLAQEAGDDHSLRLELATAYLKVGDIQGRPYGPNLGDPDGALASYGKAQQILDTLSASEPKDLDVLKNLCLVDQKKAAVQLRAGDTKAAIENGRKAISKAELLVASAPTNTEYLQLLARSYLSDGVATYGNSWDDSVEDARTGLESFRKALAIDEKLSAADPTSLDSRYRTCLDRSYAGYALWEIGDLTGDVQNYRAAFDYFRKNRETAESLYQADANKFRAYRADTIMDLGTALLNVGDARAALETYRQGLVIFEQVAASDPNNIEAQRNVADSYRKIGAAFMKAGDFDSALDRSRKSLALYENLQKLDSSSAENQRYLVTLYNQVGDVLDKMKKWPEAQNNRFKALAVLENLSKTDSKAQLSKQLMRRLTVIEDMDIAKEFEGVATDARTPVTKRRESWRQAREWYQHSLEQWQEIQTQGTLSSADASKPDEVSREIARCDQALGQ